MEEKKQEQETVKQEEQSKQEEQKQQEEKEKQSQEEQKQEEKKSECEELEKEIEELKKKLEKTEEVAKKLSALYQKIQQEFEDYKIRMRKEKEEAKDEGALRIIKGFMEIVDNFEKALESAKVSTDINSFIKGIQMIHYQLVKFLQEHGIERIEGKTEFNPQEHEALETVKTKEHKPNEIVKVLQTGYKYKGKVIRPAKVVVAVPPDDKEEIT
ncbi:MAG: nucleotide exchange factor GrpE [Aquificae bacterium]|nr:nucleotide exchange factor GrpE [Aquificota bacterium]